MLKIKKLNSGYGKVKILRDIDLVGKPNEITLIIGPNGSGKSTILKSIYNIADVYSGEVSINDINLVGLKPYELIDLGVSYVLQRNVVFSTLSVYENLEVAASKYNDGDVIEKEINRIFDIFDFLKKMRDVKATLLSGGQQRLLAIAMAFLQNPKVLLLDEPSAGLSPKAVKEVFEVVQRIRNEGVVILLVEQNVNLASKICDKIYVLNAGEIVYSGDKSILKTKKLKEIYLGR